jgi:hypothetical protein
MTTLERERELQRERDAWTSPWYPVVFALAFALEWMLWRHALYVSLGLMVVLALLVTLASVPWIGSWQHRQESVALRRHRRRWWFLVPALAVHIAVALYYGPYWRSGASSAGIAFGDTVRAWFSSERMADLCTRAAAHSDTRDLAFLLRLGADPRRADAAGQEPIYAVRHGENLALIADRIERVDPARAAAVLTYFADAGDAAAVQRLLQLGADPNRVADDAQGNTPLHMAAFSDHAEIVDLLRRAGARADTRNDAGETPWDVARRWHSAEAERVLQRTP